MKLNCFARPPKFVTRMIMMILGVIVQGFGLSLLIQIDLGTDPWTSTFLGISKLIGLDFGTCHLLGAAFLFIFVFFADNGKIGFGTLGNMLLCGYVADFFKWIWELTGLSQFFANPIVAWCMVVPALFIFMTGCSAYLCADLGGAPYDVIPFILADRIKVIPFRFVRMAWDVLFVLLGFFLGGPIGVINILFAFCFGPLISWYQKKFAVFLR